jgi:hypothetical protein
LERPVPIGELEAQPQSYASPHVATTKSPTHSGTTAFALSPEKSAGTSNLPVRISYLQRQPVAA